MWLWLWLSRRYVSRYVRRYVRRYVGRYVARSARGGRRLSLLSPLVVEPLGLGQFQVDALMPQRAVIGTNEERKHGLARRVPFSGRHPRRPGQRRIRHVERTTSAPIGHDEVEIGAAFGAGQVPRVGQIVGHVERHPGCWFSSHVGPFILPGGKLGDRLRRALAPDQLRWSVLPQAGSCRSGAPTP